MKEDISVCVQKIIKKTVESYEAVLKQYFPSFKQRFTERNLTFFFAHNYLIYNINSVVWQELPIKFEDRPGGHIDTIIIDSEKEAIIFIEAKCFARKCRIDKRLEKIQNDLKRLDDIITQRTNAGVYPEFPEEVKRYAKYALILADIWSSEELVCQNIDKLMLCIANNKMLYSCEEIVFGREIIEYGFTQNTAEKKYNYNLFYRLYKF